jgi:DNA-binding HxlR family transcriptional regulator
MPNALSSDEALDRIAQILGCKWSLRILSALSEGERRPSQLLRTCEEMAPRVMHRCLNRLERDGLLRKETFAEVPPHVEYELTDQGHQFLAVLTAAREMSDSWTGVQKKV